MKKIMFNDKFGLTKAVLDGHKTMTRREIKCPRTFNGIEVSGFSIAHSAIGDWYTYLVDDDEREIDGSYLIPTYHIGEIVAVAQSYNDIVACIGEKKYLLEQKNSAGWHNKMFVKAFYMPHYIRITDIRVERLQDISDEDCYRDGGVYEFGDRYYHERETYWEDNDGEGHPSPQLAFARLIDKVSGKGTWERNPYVFVYEFELVD